MHVPDVVQQHSDKSWDLILIISTSKSNFYFEPATIRRKIV